MYFSIRSVHDRKCPAEITLHSDYSGGNPTEAWRKHSLFREVNCCRFAIRSFISVHSRGLAMLVTHIPEVGHLIDLRIGLSLRTMHFLLSHAVRQLSSYNFTTDIRVGPAFEVHFWHALFLLEIGCGFGNEPVFVGVVAFILVKCTGWAFLVGAMLHRGVLLFPLLSDVAESRKVWLALQWHFKFACELLLWLIITLLASHPRKLFLDKKVLQVWFIKTILTSSHLILEVSCYFMGCNRIAPVLTIVVFFNTVRPTVMPVLVVVLESSTPWIWIFVSWIWVDVFFMCLYILDFLPQFIYQLVEIIWIGIVYRLNYIMCLLLWCWNLGHTQFFFEVLFHLLSNWAWI